MIFTRKTIVEGSGRHGGERGVDIHLPRLVSVRMSRVSGEVEPA